MTRKPVSSSQRRFIVTFCAVGGGLLLAYCFPYKEYGISERCFDVFLRGYARLAYLPIHLFDPSAFLVGNEIHGRFAVRIIKGCDAMEAKILFAAAIVAFPALWRRRLAMLAAGLGALTLLNVLRITSLYAVGTALPAKVEFLHLEVWPFVMVTVATLLFLWAAGIMNRTQTEQKLA
jgi:exosortase/archaeosortase family protein